MSRFYVKPSSIKGGTIRIDGQEAHHIIDVMRLKKGDRIVTFDGKGTEYEGIIKESKKASSSFVVQRLNNSGSGNKRKSISFL